ncbi:hypothetical protein ABFS82_13G174500 [Erythranthe guttata]|uniref:Uncharacterized protein n=1 Tax=Erythranthe guttata TaxID=4155 RepID=A0A022PTS4_ERYGU|nr:PREDICTED: scarecrow-like protein 21 [Erythranthe guttata]EYU19196.1 hypothetical protein MIMGU_mgv1a003912mg [Erythranthe guttata]|eukprot:XP_012827553.1 PREDICTED: scarecrow-like protein 21 [Erythranthe guttata]
MDSRYSGYSYSSSGTDLPYSSYPAVSSIPTRLLKFDSRNSPNSPLSTHFESETLTPLSDSQGSTDNLSETTPSSNSSLDYSTYLQQSRTSHTPYFPPNANNNNNSNNIRHALLELESALMAPDLEEEVTTSGRSSRSRAWSQENQTESPHHHHSFDQSHLEKRRKGMEDDFPPPPHVVVPPPNNLKQLLVACARALHENRIAEFERLVELARANVSISGEPIQRLGAYLIEGLVARKESSGTNIYRTLKCNEPDSKDLLNYMHILYEICPYLKFGYMAANGAIAEACKNEDRIHIVDFQIAQGTQWMTLLQALAARPSGPPHVRITGIDDPVSKYARGEGLSLVEKRLAAISEKFKIPVEFHAIPVFAPDITKEMLDVRQGEALAVNFPLQLHHTPDESVDVTNPRDGLLRMVRSLSPKVVTLVEQESNTNTAPFVQRFVETLDYYSAIFESIDVTMGRDRKERINVEQHCLARDMVNIIACEGKERVERHELLGKWRSRFMMAGFRQFPLSGYVNSVIGGLLRSYSEHYTLVEKDGGMLLGWKDRNLVSASAWH